MQKVKSIALISVIVLLGFLREYLFININWIYLTLTINRRNAAREEFYFLLDWNPSNINILKFFLTLVFCCLFMGLTWLIINHLFKNRLYNRIVLYTFGVLIVVSLIFQGINYFFDSFLIYGIVRTLMGYAQSFIPLLILGLTFYFIPKVQNK